MNEEKQEIPRIDMDEEGRWGSPDGEFMYAKEVLPVLDAANKRIAELEAENKKLVDAMVRCIEYVRSIQWGYDGDSGATNAVEVMNDKIAEIQANATGGANT